MGRWLAYALTLFPLKAAACALPPSIILTLPTGYYMVGAAVTVALTAMIGAAAPRLPAMKPRVLWAGIAGVPSILPAFAGFIGFLILVFFGVFGADDPMHNLLTLIFWSGVWVALPLASMLLGNLWHPINPWRAPVRIARVLLGRTAGVGVARLGHWPAVLGLAGFFWFELISVSPDDPRVLAQVIVCYWIVVFLAAVAEGEEWLEQGEFLSVYFGFLSKVAPFWAGPASGRLMWGWPGTQVMAMPALGPSAVIFVTVALAGLTFDGLSGTFWWLDKIGQNPLEFAGRSAVQGVNTFGLIGTWALTAGAIFAAFAAGRLLGGQTGPFWRDLGPAMLAFLAIAAGYHAAHYLTILLTTGQYAIFALNDPFFRGDAYLGLPPFYISFGFLTDRATMTLIWNLQFAAILGAHLLAVVLALKLSAKDGPVRAVLHLPMTALMVGYTLLGLWLLASPSGA
jgi:hypothetical protein